MNQRSIYYHIKQFERKESVEDLRLKDLLDEFAEYLEGELLRENPSYKENFPEQHHPYGFHINGFKDDEEDRPVGVTYELFIGKKRITRRRDALGCTVGGNMDVVRQLWNIGKEDPSRQFRYNLLSLQDAVDLGAFLIDVTSKFQRFARDIQTVGGDIDIALLTPFHGFQWIERKGLMATIEPKSSIEQWKEIDD